MREVLRAELNHCEPADSVTVQGDPIWLVITGLSVVEDERGGMYKAVVEEVAKKGVTIKCLENRANGEGKDEVSHLCANRGAHEPACCTR